MSLRYCRQARTPWSRLELASSGMQVRRCTSCTLHRKRLGFHRSQSDVSKCQAPLSVWRRSEPVMRMKICTLCILKAPEYPKWNLLWLLRWCWVLSRLHLAKRTWSQNLLVRVGDDTWSRSLLVLLYHCYPRCWQKNMVWLRRRKLQLLGIYRAEFFF